MPDFHHDSGKSGRFDQTISCIPYIIHFSIQIYSDSDWSCDVLSYEIISFGKYLAAVELYAEGFENIERNWLYKKCYKLEANIHFLVKRCIRQFKTGIQNMSVFKICN